MINKEGFEFENDTESFSVNNFINNDLFPINNITEEINEKNANKFSDIKESEIAQLSFNESINNLKGFSMSKGKDIIDHKLIPKNDSENNFHFDYSINSEENIFNLNLEEQETKSLVFFEECLKKEFSSKYSKAKIFNVIAINRKRKRKYMRDDKRKRIKSYFYKEIKNKLNKKLKVAKIDNLFNFPQSMVTDVTKEINKKHLGMTLGSILSFEGFEDKSLTNKKKIKEKRNNGAKFPLWKHFRKYIINIKTKKIIENNKEILNILDNNKNNQIDKLLNKKMEDIYSEYLKSENFEKSLEHLNKKGNYYDYIYDYIKVANNFVEYYKKNKKTK